MARPTQRRREEERLSCAVAGCPTTFGRIHELVRHHSEFHAEKKRCPVPDCKWRGTKREHRVRDHIAKKHPNYLSVELDIPEDFSPNSSPQGPSTQVNAPPYNDNTNANTTMQYNSPPPWDPHAPSGAANAPASSPYSTGSTENATNTSNYAQQQEPTWQTSYNIPAPEQAGYNAAQTYMQDSSPMSGDYEFDGGFDWQGTYNYGNTSNDE